METYSFMSQTYVMVLMISAILVIIAYYIIYTQIIGQNNEYPNSSSCRFKEEFVSLNTDMQERYREENGIEKCGALLNYSPSLCNVEFETMNTFVNGLRFRKWKPVREDPMANSMNSNSAYCYLYDDEKNNTRDVILDGIDDDFDCSKANPIFQSPLISNVFQTEYRDRSHQVPIKKCVFEIDPERVNDMPVVNQFWSRLRIQDCQMLSKDLRLELKTKNQTLEALEMGRSNIWDSYQQASNLLVEKENENALCVFDNRKLDGDIENTKKAYDFYKSELDTTSQQLENIKKEIDVLDADIEEARLEERRYNAFYQGQRIASLACETNEAECQKDKTHKSFILEETIKRNKALVDEIGRLQGRIVEFTEKYEILLARKVKCDEDLKRLKEVIAQKTSEFDDLSELYERCLEENSLYFKKYNTFRDGYKTSSNIYYECMDTKEGLSNRLSACRADVTECINSLNNIDVYRENNENIDPVEVKLEDIDFANIEPYFKRIRDVIDRVKIDTRDLQEKYDAQVIENARLANLIEELRKRKSILQDDLKDAKNKFLLLSTKAYGNMSDDIRNQTQSILDRYLAMNENEFRENIKRQCSLEFIELEKEKEAAMNEKNELDKILENLGKNDQTCPSSCDISVSQCIIHHNAPEICGEMNPDVNGVFKAYDKDGNLLDTVVMHKKGAKEVIKAQDEAEYNFFTFESSNPIHRFNFIATSQDTLNATFKIYDQTDDLVQTIHMTRGNINEQVTRSGLVDLKFFTFESDDDNANIVYEYVALEGSDGSPCFARRRDFPSVKRQFLAGKITGNTRYKKIHLYRGITCITLSSPDVNKVVKRGSIESRMEFKRVSLLLGTRRLQFNS